METTSHKTNYKLKKRNDRILLMGIMFFALVTMVLLWKRGSEVGMTAVVLVDGEEVGRYSLLQEKEITIGDTNVLIITGGAANMIFARCPDQVCVKHSPIAKTGETIICLPNKVVVTIEGLNDGGASGMNSKVAEDDDIDIMVK